MLLTPLALAAALALAQQAAAASASSRPPPTAAAPTPTAAATSPAGPPPSVQASPLRYTAEGLSTIWFVNTNASSPFNRSVITSCIITPYRWGTDFAQVPGPEPQNAGRSTAPALAAAEAAGAVWRWNGSSPALGARGRGGATTKVIFPAEIVNGTHARCYPPAISAPGPGVLSLFPQAPNTFNVSYFWLCDVAVGRRPYIGEKEGSVLLRVDRAAAERQQQLKVSLRVTAALPFGGHRWEWTVPAGQEESVLNFDLTGLPASVNNDLQINVTVTSPSTAAGLATTTTTVTKFKRLIRAPVPQKDVGAVQVDAATQGLRIDGKPWNGNGYFMWSGASAPPAAMRHPSPPIESDSPEQHVLRLTPSTPPRV